MIIMNSVTNRACMAKKKMYTNPEIEIAEVVPQTIICASITEGGNTSEGGGGNTMYTD